MTTGRNLFEPIKAALGPERAMAFMELVNALDLGPNDPELVLCAALGSFVVSLGDFRTWGTTAREELGAVLAEFVAGVDLKVAGAFTRGADEFQTELRLAARETAQSEYRAAASLRSQAITDEVAALRAAATDLARREAELRVRETIAPNRAAAQPGGGWIGPKTAALAAAAFVLGWGAALLSLHGALHHT